jgi:long-chain acyl-CoA synthetase
MNAKLHMVQSYLAAHAKAQPDKVFIESIDQGKAITYRQFDLLTNQFAQLLKSRGVRANDRIVLLSGNSIEHLVVFLGTLKYGAAICTVNVDTNRAYLPEILSALKARLVCFQKGLGLEPLSLGESIAMGEWHACGGTELFAALETLPPSPVEPVNGPADDALIVYTSGTTALPKGSISEYARLMTNTEAVADALGLSANDRVLEFRSLNWMSAQGSSALAPLFRGATLLLARKFSESHYFDWVRSYRATVGIGNPTAIAMLLNRPIAIARAELASLRFVTSSSAPLPLEHWRAFEEIYGVPVAGGYGATEALWISLSNEKTRRIGSVGQPFACQKLTVVDAAGQPLPPGEIGEVELGADPATRYRYVGMGGETETTAVGRLRPGDIGYLDDDDYLFLTSRARDLIIRGGINISPVELEQVLLQIPGVAEAAAIGAPDRIYGEEVVVYLVLKPRETVSTENVLAHCGGKLTRAKMPKEIHFKEALPKNDRGKLDRKALLEEWKQEHPSS